MKNLHAVRASVLALVTGITATSLAAVKVEEQILLAKTTGAQCAISPFGAHVAAVVAKGSRAAVVYDGVEGPRFDLILNLDGSPSPARNSGRPSVGGPVVFSSDGVRYAYAARTGDEYVVMVDGKELARGPWEEPFIAIDPFTFSPTGKHFYFGINFRNAGYKLQVDDKQGPACYGRTVANSQSNEALLFSPDDAHYAYVGQNRQEGPDAKWAVVDGKQVKYFGEDLQFNAHGRLFSVLTHPGVFGTPPIPGSQTLLIDGKAVLKARYFLHQPWISPSGDHYAVAITPKEGAASFLTVDGKPMPGTEGLQINGVYFSPDGKRLAVICTPAGSTNGSFVILDAKKGPRYQSIDVNSEPHPMFTPDSSKFVFAANNNGRFLVINGEESDAGFSRGPYFAGDGARSAYILSLERNQELIVDEKSVFKGYLDQFTFSPDGSRYGFLATQNGQQKILELDGTPYTSFAVGEWTRTPRQGAMERYSYLFSPDCKHVVYLADDPNNEKQRGLWIDKTFVFHSPSNYSGSILRPTFTPDSRHLFWYDRVAPSVNEPQGHFQLYVDGEPSIAFPAGVPDLSSAGAWEITPEGVLQFVVINDDAVKRYRVTPSPDKTFTTLLASIAPKEGALLFAINDDNTLTGQRGLMTKTP
jgi:hypothetical protein